MGCGKVKFVIGLLLMVLVHVNSDVEAKLEKPPLYNFRVRSDGKLEGEGCVSESSSTWYREAVLLLGQQRYRESAALLKLVERCGCKHYKLFQDMSVALSHVESHYMAYVSASLALGHSECLRFLTTGGSVPHCDAPELLLNYIAARDRIGQGMELSAALRLFDVYIQLACKRDAGGNIACHGQSAARAIVECWRIGQYTCSNWFSWDVMSSLLTAAVESDVRKCKRQRSQENTSTADQGVCYSIVQPWEATVFPLEHEHVVEIARLRINSLVKQNQVKFPAQVFKFSASQNNLIRVGLVVHKISGLESGLLRDFLTSPVSLAGQQASRFSFTLFSWEVSPSISLAPQDVPNAGYKGLHAIARVVGLELLNEFEAASRINSEEINILMDFMGWIPEGRQSLTLETMAFRPAPVQVSRDVHSTSGGGPIDYLLADRVALPPELAALQPDSLLLTTPSFFPNSHFFNYDFAYNWTEEPVMSKLRSNELEYSCLFYKDACEWSKDAVAILGLYEYYKLDPTIFRIWAQMENFSPKKTQRCEPFKGMVETDWLPGLSCGALLLDPRHYSTHTVAVDCLWAGVPVVTRAGPRLTSRVPASFLTSLGVEGTLVVRSWQEYAQVARAFVRSGSLRRSFRRRMQGLRLSSRAFQRSTYTKKVLQLLGLAWEVHVFDGERDNGRKNLHAVGTMG
ncbi:hypothetical protein GUITHDRAFT_113647 [Guillardia theta CCMP2712]|uniref:O-GlcNAc transferase C-terminal domain-containing protein n=1 Tax=Guillardia theta (strain CCMP2712) TaxID=905079 RepID=L1IVM7_GUITC|nr:hypothetical protein GUITHDRAFT_113647 [Guillardia theta CCMP2712]EKX40167.1 hypothetical protein GUITHDRAFT_113647 [Guillardia theta CCMP2712]|eukprot:XP_005827147.1 hypothetical protein GUITHDRAFT_113647 [Guillardia theta CCMP2712]